MTKALKAFLGKQFDAVYDREKKIVDAINDTMEFMVSEGSTVEKPFCGQCDSRNEYCPKENKDDKCECKCHLPLTETHQPEEPKPLHEECKMGDHQFFHEDSWDLDVESCLNCGFKRLREPKPEYCGCENPTWIPLDILPSYRKGQWCTNCHHQVNPLNEPKEPEKCECTDGKAGKCHQKSCLVCGCPLFHSECDRGYCSTHAPKETDYYTRREVRDMLAEQSLCFYTKQEINEKLKKVIHIGKSGDNIATECNDMIYVNKAEEREFREAILSYLEADYRERKPENRAWFLEDMRKKFL